MTEYLLLIPDNETEWTTLPEEERQAVYAKHSAFHEALERRGHKVVHGAELTPSTQARTVRNVEGETRVTDGPYAEAVEHISGFYLIESADLDDLLDCTGIIAGDASGIEVRECRSGS